MRIIDSISFSVPVGGRVTADMLRNYFGFDHVSEVFLNEERYTTRVHDLCRGVNEEMETVRKMELLTEFSTQPLVEDLVLCAARQGLRPATKNELYWFYRHHGSLAERYGLLRLQSLCSALALGTSFEVHGMVYVSEIEDDYECGPFFQTRQLVTERPSIGARENVLFVHI